VATTEDKHRKKQGAADPESKPISQETVCVFTPAYNRAYCLSDLFESLKAQTSFDFCWLIVDDGSTDNTEELVRSFQAENTPFPIQYIKQENGGKARAHNTGVEHCSNELFFCVDSDDYLTPHAIESILEAWQPVRCDPDIAGVIGLDGKDESTPLTKLFPEGLERTTRWDLYFKHGHNSDVASVYRTDLLRIFPFEVAEGEKFMAETFVYYQIDQFFKMLLVNEIWIVAVYRDDGYTSNVRKVTRQNPRSYIMHKRRMIEYSDTFFLVSANTTLYLVGCILANAKGGIKNAPYPALAALAYLPARLLCVTVYRDRG